MRLLEGNKVNNYEDLIMTKKEKKEVFVPQNILNRYGKEFFLNRLLIKDKTAYYMKYDSVINELIGSYLSNVLNLENVNYELAQREGYFFIISKLFYEEKYDYFFAADYKHSIKIENVKKRPNGYKDHLKLLHKNILIKILKLIAVDIKMGQYDRHEWNIMFKKNKSDKTLDLAPIYDFSNSYDVLEVWDDCYNNSFINMNCDKKDIKTLIDTYPTIKEYFYTLRNISVENILKELEKQYGIKIDEYGKINRIRLDKKYTKRLY